MKKLTLVVLCVLACGVEAAPLAPTNGVPLKDGWRFGLTDYHLNGQQWEHKLELLRDDSIDSRNPIGFVVGNVMTNQGLLFFARTFSFELLDAKNRRVTKTAVGEEQSSQPPRTTRGRGQLRSGSAREPELRAMGSVPELFKVAEPGVYTLEAVMYFYEPDRRGYQRRASPPVRIPVLVGTNALAPPKR